MKPYCNMTVWTKHNSTDHSSINPSAYDGRSTSSRADRLVSCRIKTRPGLPYCECHYDLTQATELYTVRPLSMPEKPDPLVLPLVLLVSSHSSTRGATTE